MIFMDERNLNDKVNQLYLFIINKYKELIESEETKSLSDLPEMITPDSKLVNDLSKNIKGKFNFYYYYDNFYAAGRVAFDYVVKDVKNFSLPIQFWLHPDDVINLKIGDIIDKNILLCSLLISLGNYSAKVLVIDRVDYKSVFVYCEFNYRYMLFDIKNNHVEMFNSNTDMFSFIKLDDKTSAYEFNNLSYFDIT